MQIRSVGKTITALPIEKDAQTKSGIFLPTQAAKELETKVAKVISVGPEVTRVKVGDVFIFKPYACFDVKIDKQDYVLVEDEDSLVVLDEYGQ